MGVGTTIYILLRKVVLQIHPHEEPEAAELGREKERLGLNGIVSKWNEKRRGNHE